MTYAQQTWTDNVTPVDSVHMLHIEAGIAAAAPGYGTTLPGSPVDGQEYVLVDSTTAPTYQWRFRYNAGGGTYKWEFIGGTPLAAYVDTLEAITVDNTWHDPATVGPQVTVPRAGQYFVQAGATIINGTANSILAIGAAIGAGTPPAGLRTQTDAVATVNFWMPISFPPVAPLTAAASDLIRLRYLASTGTASVGWRKISVLPARVS